MIVVTLFRCESDPAEAVGRLEFYGTPVGAADGRALLAFDGGACGAHAQVRPNPVGVATGDEITTIGLAQCRDQVAGRAGRFRWKYE